MRDAAGMGRVRVVVGLLALAGVVAIVVAVAAGGGKRTAVPEGGSAFGARPSAAADRGRHLLDALAPLLAPAPRARGVGRRLRAAGSNPDRLGLPAGAAAARLFMVGFDGTRPRASFFERLRTRGWGGVVLERNNYIEPGQLATLAGEVAIVARNAGHVVPLVAAPQSGGDGTAFPNLPPQPQPLATTPGAARRQAELAGQQLQALGIHMTFAPSADLGAAGGPWEARAFGDDPGVVTAAVRAAVNGYRRAGVAAAVGHFPGEGGASQDPAAGTATVGLSLDELRARDVRPFAAVARRAPAVQLLVCAVRRVGRRHAGDAAAGGDHAAAQGPRLSRRRRQRRPCRSDARQRRGRRDDRCRRAAGGLRPALAARGPRGTGAGLAGGRPRDPLARVVRGADRAVAGADRAPAPRRRPGQLDAAAARERARRA